jgi:hypothetical protein
MANNSRVNPMVADTASDSRLVSDTTEVMISAIVVKASSVTWAVLLKNGAGNTIFDASNTAGPITFTPATPFLTTGLVVSTLTNATAYIYTTPG